jgi:hypothetical protein
MTETILKVAKNMSLLNPSAYSRGFRRLMFLPLSIMFQSFTTPLM